MGELSVPAPCGGIAVPVRRGRGLRCGRVWEIEPREGVARILGGAVYAVAVVGFLLAQELDLRLRREERRKWWAGTGRDLLNVVGLLALSGSLHLRGFAPPAALLVGGSLTLALFGASVLVATQVRTARPRAWAFAVGAALALPPLLWPGEVLGVFEALARSLFPTPSP